MQETFFSSLYKFILKMIVLLLIPSSYTMPTNFFDSLSFFWYVALSICKIHNNLVFALGKLFIFFDTCYSILKTNNIFLRFVFGCYFLLLLFQPLIWAIFIQFLLQFFSVSFYPNDLAPITKTKKIVYFITKHREA